jgi:hypothetical protein
MQRFCKGMILLYWVCQLSQNFSLETVKYKDVQFALDGNALLQQ